MLGNYIYNGEISELRRKPQVTAEALRTKILRTKMMPEYSIDTRLPGIIDAVREVVDVQAANGETVTVGVDENGEVVAAETKAPNWLPLIVAAGGAWLFLA